MSSFRRFSPWLAAVLLLAAAALGCDLLLTRAIGRSESLDAGRLLRLAAGADREEIAIFGPSTAGADYIPQILGRRFYNYGLDAAGPDVVNVLLALELRTGSRQPIVIDFPRIGFHEIGDPRNYIPLGGRPEIRRLMRANGQWKWYYAVPGLRYFGAWDWYVKGLLTDRIALTKRVRRGHTERLDDPPWEAGAFARNVERRLATPTPWLIDPRQERELIARMHSAPDRLFILVLAPVHASFEAHATGEAEYRAELARLAASTPNVRIIDMTHPHYPDQYFRDTAHLNDTGARAFSAELRQKLAALGVDVSN